MQLCPLIMVTLDHTIYIICTNTSCAIDGFLCFSIKADAFVWDKNPIKIADLHCKGNITPFKPICPDYFPDSLGNTDDNILRTGFLRACYITPEHMIP